MITLLSIALLAAPTFAPTPELSPDWIDNFNDGSAVDGSPVEWVATPVFAAEFAVNDGDLAMTMPEGTSPAISSARVPIVFGAGASVRARMVAFNTPGRFAVAFADEPTGIKGYVASFSSCGGGRLELFRADVIGAIIFLADGQVSVPFSPETEFILQLDVFDGVVAARLWLPGEPFPSAQISALDSTYEEGVVSIAIQDFGSGNCVPIGSFSDVGAFIRYAQASSTPLTHSDLGDLDASGTIDGADLGILLAEWGGLGASDLDGSGMVDGADLGLMVANWTPA